MTILSQNHHKLAMFLVAGRGTCIRRWEACITSNWSGEIGRRLYCLVMESAKGNLIHRTASVALKLRGLCAGCVAHLPMSVDILVGGD